MIKYIYKLQTSALSVFVLSIVVIYYLTIQDANALHSPIVIRSLQKKILNTRMDYSGYVENQLICLSFLTNRLKRIGSKLSILEGGDF